MASEGTTPEVVEEAQRIDQSANYYEVMSPTVVVDVEEVGELHLEEADVEVRNDWMKITGEVDPPLDCGGSFGVYEHDMEVEVVVLDYEFGLSDFASARADIYGFRTDDRVRLIRHDLNSLEVQANG